MVEPGDLVATNTPRYLGFHMNPSPTTSFPPIHNLPPEILGNIFVLAFKGVYRLGDANRLAVSSVCSLWRRIALGLAVLWSTIIWIDTRLYAERCIEVDIARRGSVPWTQLCLSRNRQCDLDIHVDADDYEYDAEADFGPVGEILLTYRHRWRDVYLHLPPILLQSLLPFSTSLPRLATFVAISYDFDPGRPFYLLDAELHPSSLPYALRKLALCDMNVTAAELAHVLQLLPQNS